MLTGFERRDHPFSEFLFRFPSVFQRQFLLEFVMPMTGRDAKRDAFGVCFQTLELSLEMFRFQGNFFNN